MKITVAETAGFCFGVDRAVNLVYKMLDEGHKVCTLGPIIHNPQVIEDLENRGVVIVDSPEAVPSDCEVVIRAHGVTKETVASLEKAGISFTDATCPYVLKIHKLVKQHSTENNIVLISGDENHPEVCGFRSYCRGKSYVFKNEEELLDLLNKNSDIEKSEIVFLSQTTFSVKEWKKCAEIIQKVCTNSISFDTICRATQNRQEEANELSQKVDCMLVIGGRFSSNTVKLKNVCSENCRTHLIERLDELYGIDFTGCSNIGITAGASTPARIIKEVEVIMTENFNEQKITKETQDQELFLAAVDSIDDTSDNPNVVGIVVGIAPNEIQVDIGRKYAGFIPVEEYSNDPTADPSKELKIGDELNLIIMKTNDNEGTMKLSKRLYDRRASWKNIVAAKENDEVLEAVVSEVVRGGVIVYPLGARVFIPASLTGLGKDEDLSQLLKQTVKFKLIDLDEQKKRVVGSVRAVLREERKAATEAFWAEIAEGQEFTGTVKSLTNYGAFVDLGGVDGMVHISELSWTRIKHPSEVVNVGDTVKVYIKALDAEKRKISLGYKRIEDNPWEIFKRDYEVGSVVEATVVGLTTFGAFARIIDGVEGLIHISQIANRHIASPKEVLSIGDVVTVKITDVDYDKHRISLSIRVLLEPEVVEETEEAAEEVVEETADAVAEEVADEAVEAEAAE
ncbi:MAG: bifunctional 4-hydroxy-3-methylbut-2-enyl diphosphate reductase/30S ribosomal protein S1 [Clostridia bacterium]|nr:bifunctional 4-hydroxy-3-methylbut-2-enyl diphosphate reductase/30S ribosomal protein S1 [Clostridia bacterium]